MEMFYTPEDVENEYGVQTKTLANWRANLIGPDCLKWKDKILYHSGEIEEWFETQEIDAQAEPEEKEQKPEREKEPELSNEAKPHTEAKTDTKPDKYSEAAKEILENRLLTPQDLAREYQIPIKTLANWRSQGKGPAYFKLGKNVRYRGVEVNKWVAGSKVKIYGNDD
jgi:hypothetical protein